MKILICQKYYVTIRELCSCHFLHYPQILQLFYFLHILVHYIFSLLRNLLQVILVGWMGRSFKWYSSVLHPKPAICLCKLLIRLHPNAFFWSRERRQETASKFSAPPRVLREGPCSMSSQNLNLKGWQSQKSVLLFFSWAPSASQANSWF